MLDCVSVCVMYVVANLVINLLQSISTLTILFFVYPQKAVISNCCIICNIVIHHQWNIFNHLVQMTHGVCEVIQVPIISPILFWKGVQFQNPSWLYVGDARQRNA